MILVVGSLPWALIAGLLGALVALALRRWVRAWSIEKRICVALAVSLSPSLLIVALYAAKLGLISMWFSPDEFLIPFAVHILVVAAVSTPIAWLVSRRAPRQPVPTDVFD